MYKMEKTDILTAVLLSIVTCGIYQFYWLYKLLKDFYAVTGEQNNNPGLDILLCFITCGIYYIYLCYRLGKLVAKAQVMYGLPPQDDAIVYLILALFGGGIGSLVTLGLVQNIVNQSLAEAVDRYYGNPSNGNRQ